MTRSLAAMLLAPLVVVAAPVPKDKVKERIEKKYGRVVDPEGDCKFELDGGDLKVTLPADKARDLTDRIDTAPRLVREVTGDFVLTVRVRVPLDKDAGLAKEMAELKAGLPYNNPDIYPFLAAGVEFKNGDDRVVRAGFTRHRWRDRNEVQPGLTYHMCDAKGCRLRPEFYGGYGASGFWNDDVEGMGDTAHLRYTRLGENLTTQTSADGKKWFDVHDFGGWMPEDKVTVSLFAHHGSDKGHTVTFSEYSLEPLKAEKK